MVGGGRILCPGKFPFDDIANTVPDYSYAIAESVSAPVLSHHISEAIGYRNLDLSDYGTAY